MPTWDAKQLKKHHNKRITKDAGCFEDLMGIVGRDMTESEYEQRSQDAVTNAWGEYEGQGRNVALGIYNPPTVYFVDDDLVVALTNLARTAFITCFHEHFNQPHGVVPGPGATLTRRQIEYRLASEVR